MDKFYFDIEKHLVGDDEIHYTISNIDDFCNLYWSTIKPEVKKERHDTKKPKLTRRIIVNNLKVISQQIIVKLKAKCTIVKQVEGEDYIDGKGVRNIKALQFPYATLVDLNALVNKSAEIIASRDEFDKYCKLACKMIEDNDDRVPNSLASTIRKDIIKTFEADKQFRDIQWYCRVDSTEFLHYKNYYHGGLCFVNKSYEGKTLYNVHYADMTSAYITQMCMQQFPLSKPYEINTNEISKDDLYNILNFKYYFACIRFNGVRLKDKAINPFKMQEGEDVQYLTNLDFRIVMDTIDCDSFNIGELWVFPEVGLLPEKVRKVMYNLFDNKQKIKALKGTDSFDAELYEVAKIKVNCSYGIFGSGFDVKYCNIFWAIYTTAWQRYYLWLHIKLVGLKNVIYCDTDSIYSVVKPSLQEGNELGKWEIGQYSRMIVRGNKGYVTEDINTGKLHIVLSGATKKGVESYLKANNITNDMLFREGYFMHLTIPAKYEVVYRYVSNDKEVYKKCYDLSLSKGETILKILFDKYGLGGIYDEVCGHNQADRKA